MDVYKVGVSIALANNVSPVLALISRDLLGLRGPISRIEGGFSRWHKALLGAAGILGGTAIVGGLVKIAEHGEKLLDQQDKLQRAGMNYADVLRLQGDYYEKIAKAVPTSTASEYLKTVNELRAVTGALPEAAALAPKAMMVDTLLSNTLGREVHGEYYKLLRSAEMKGISTDPAKLEQFTDQVFSMITAFGGKLSAEDFQTMARRGGTAFMNAKPESIGPIGVLAADLGGSAAGTTLMTLQQLQTGANTLSKQQAKVFADLGLLDMSKATATGFGGGRMQLAPGAIKGSLEHAGDLPGWIKDVVYPALQKASGGDEALLQNLIAKISPNRNAAKLIEMFGNPKFLNQQQKDLGLAGQVEPIPEAYRHFIERNPKGVKSAFNDQYESMMQAIGAPVMQAALPVMKAVTTMFQGIGQFANSNPETIKAITFALAGVAGALVAMGAISLASLVGIPAGLTAIAGAVVAMGALHWDQISGYLRGFNTALSEFINWLAGLVGKIKGLLGMGAAGIEKGKSEGGASGGWEPGGGASGSWHPTRFDPGNALKGAPGGAGGVFPGGTRAAPVPQINLNLNIDGRALAQAVSEQQSLSSTYQVTTPASDGSGIYGP